MYKGEKRMDKKTHEIEIIENGQLFILKIDDITGDVISKTPAKMRRDTSGYFKKGEFLTMATKFSTMFIMKKDYANLTFRVLFALMTRIEFNNRIATFRQAELARELEAHQPHVSTSLKVLERDGVIIKQGHDYYFSPRFVRYVNDGKFGKEKVDLSGVNVDDIDPEQMGL
jgi:DNA-binding MarR family transcriptional regulator